MTFTRKEKDEREATKEEERKQDEEEEEIHVRLRSISIIFPIKMFARFDRDALFGDVETVVFEPVSTGRQVNGHR